MHYSIQATAPCRTSGTEARTNTVAVSGSDSSVSEITLTFDKGLVRQVAQITAPMKGALRKVTAASRQVLNSRLKNGHLGLYR